MQIYHGTFVTSASRDRLIVRRDQYILVKDGIIQKILPVLPEEYRTLPVTEFGEDILIPAFSDLHVHAPQYPQRGLGMDLLLEDWLNEYTFPLEARFADPEYAGEVYDAFLADLIRNGTMHACVFGTIHRRATADLAAKMEQKGFRALIGKVNMDVNAPDSLRETVEESLRETEAYLEELSANRFARPVLTPRFAPTCSRELLSGLGALGNKYQTGTQTHLVESRWEAAEAVRLFPEASCDTEIYERAGLLGNGPLVAAHFIFPSEDDIRILKKYDGFAVQCPDATVNIIAGIMQTDALAKKGVRLGLGSDLAGGHLPGIYTQAARSVQLSKLKWFYEPEGNCALTFANAFSMATREGGALFGKVGCIEEGYAFDALLIRNFSDPFRALLPEESVERFCYTGNAADIKKRYLGGREV